MHFVPSQGFGDPLAEYWLGNEFVSKLTYQKSYILRIQLSDWEGNSEYSQYEQFYLEDEAKNYRYVPSTRVQGEQNVQNTFFNFRQFQIEDGEKHNLVQIHIGLDRVSALFQIIKNPLISNISKYFQSKVKKS